MFENEEGAGDAGGTDTGAGAPQGGSDTSGDGGASPNAVTPDGVAGESGSNGQGAAEKFNDAFGTKLSADLAARWSKDESDRRNSAAAKNRTAEGEEEAPLTRSEMLRMQQDSERKSTLAGKRKSWRAGVSELVDKPVQVGNHSGMINDQATYDKFENYMADMINNGKLAPRDFYKLMNFDRIVSDERAHAVREATKKFKGGRTSQSGDQEERRTLPRNGSDSGVPGQGLSMEEYMKKNNPTGYNRIMSTAKE
tara:strand:- start:811 stop:1569 length:759 start_codon:yes stop_codon:yes gene_type:complete